MGIEIEGKAFNVRISLDGDVRFVGYDGEECGARLHNALDAFIRKAEVGDEMSISITREPDVE